MLGTDFPLLACECFLIILLQTALVIARSRFVILALHIQCVLTSTEVQMIFLRVDIRRFNFPSVRVSVCLSWIYLTAVL